MFPCQNGQATDLPSGSRSQNKNKNKNKKNKNSIGARATLAPLVVLALVLTGCVAEHDAWSGLVGVGVGLALGAPLGARFCLRWLVVLRDRGVYVDEESGWYQACRGIPGAPGTTYATERRWCWRALDDASHLADGGQP